MGSDGCRGMHMHAANAKQGKRVIYGRAVYICDKHVFVGNDHKDGVVSHDSDRTFWGNGGDVRGAHVHSIHI